MKALKFALPAAALSLLLSGCVVKKDPDASAAISAEIAKQLAKSFAGSASGVSASIQGTSAAAQMSCTTTSSGSTTITCSGPGMEMQMTISGTGISGYQRLSGMQMDVGGKKYSITGTINISGSTSATVSATGQFNATTSQTMNGNLSISGPENFAIEYRAFSVTVVISGSASGFSTSFSCGGKLAVDTLEYAVKADCSI